MNTPTYDEIRKLTNELRNETKVKARRDLGTTLYNKLKNENTLRKLAIEATPKTSNWPDEDSIAAKRCRALSLVWTSVIQGAVHATQSIVAGGKVKLTEQDVTLPYNLLIACDKANEVLGEPNVSIPPLPKRLVRNLLKYCLELLNDQDIIVARLKLLEMLNFLCSKPDYVGAFKYHNDFAGTLGELFVHLTPEVEEKNVFFFNEAAKALDNLLSTSRQLGIQMHVFINDIMASVSAFCKSYAMNQKMFIRPQAPALPHLYNVISNILLSHPDHAIGPMKRFGRSMLRHAKHCYPNAKSPLKEALNSYIAAHLFISQFAGSIEGRIAGNMGNLGKASLTPEQLNQLLDLVMKDVSYFFEGKAITPSSRHRSISWSTLDLRQRQHLELAARLLACAQQDYLCKVQWDMIEDPTEALMSSMQIRGPGNDEWIDQEIIVPGDCPTGTFSSSPWMRHILLRLASEVDWKAFADRNTSERENQSASAGEIQFAGNSHVLKAFPFLERIKDTVRNISTQALAFLPVIGACTEVFPFGQCWTSNIFEGSTSLVPKDLISHDVLIYQSCTVGDFSLLIFLLAANLEEQSGSTSNQETQLWILVTLTKLTAATSLFYRHSFRTRSDSLSPLEQSWQLVWKVLFRPDLRYTEYTKDVGPHKLGELVLVLIRDMVQHKCTDPLLWRHHGIKDKQMTFLHRNQSQIWNLYVFRNAYTIASTVPLELICWMCQNVGISDSGMDHIDPIPARSLMDDDTTFSTGRGMSLSRRRRLVSLALSVMERYQKNEREISFEMVYLAIFTVITLVRGRIPKMMVFSTGWRHQDNIDCTFRLTNVPLVTCQSKENSDWREMCIEVLWKKQDAIMPLPRESYPREFDIAARIISLCCHADDNHDISDASRSVDFVTDTESSQLSWLVQLWLRKIFFSTVDGLSDSSDVASENVCSSGLVQKRLYQQSLMLKTLFTVQLITMESDNTNILLDIVQSLHACFNSLSHIIDAKYQRDTITNLSQVSRAVLEILSISPFDLSLPSFRIMTESCKSMLRIFMERLSDGTHTFTSSQENERESKRAEDDLMDDDILENSLFQYQLSKQTDPKPSIVDTSSGDESQQTNRRKRKRSVNLVSMRREKLSRYSDNIPKIQDITCAEEVACLLLVLEPSLQNCDLVCQALLGADHELDPTDLNGDVDLRSARACLFFLTCSDVLTHSIAKKCVPEDKLSLMASAEESVIVLLHKVLDLIRVNARPSDWLSLNGFMEVSSVDKHSMPLTVKDFNLLVELMLFKDGTCSRPFLRAERMRAALSAFLKASEMFHDVLDKHFSGMVKTAMTDSDIHVRRLAYSGVNAALTLLDEKKVLHAINKLICPISQSQDPNIRQKQFEEWYRNAGHHGLPVEGPAFLERIDCLDVMESDSIRCRSIIAASTSNTELFLDSIFEILMIPLSRPELDNACLQALDKVARLRNYGSVETMVDSENPALLYRWIRSDHDSLPLLLTAPAIVRLNSQFNCAKRWRGQDVDTETLRLDALLNFVSKNVHLLVPLSLFYSVSSMPGSISTTKLNEDSTLSFLVSAHKLKLLSSMSCEDAVNDLSIRSGIKRLLRRHAADVKAFCFVMSQSAKSSHIQMSNDALRLLSSVVPVEDVDSRTKKKAHLVVGRIIDLVTFSESLPDMIPSDELAYVQAIDLAIDEMFTSSRITGDKLRTVGTNAVATLIRSFAQLDKAPVFSHKRPAWKAVSLQCELIQVQTGNAREQQISIEFCIHMLTEVLLKEKFAVLRPDVLSLLKQLLQKGTANGCSLEFGRLIKRLVGASYHVHESCQKKMLKNHKDYIESNSQKMRRSCGLALLADSSKKQFDVWGWIVPGEHSPHQVRCDVKNSFNEDAELQRTIIGAYEVLKWILDCSTRLALDSVTFAPIAPPHAISSNDISLLSSMHESFAIQVLALRYWEQPDTAWTQTRPTFQSLTLELESKLKNLQGWMIMKNDNTLSLDQSLIYAVLVQLERLEFHDQGLDSVAQGFFEKLIRCLSLICSAICPIELQVAASRCLGKLKPEIICCIHKTDSIGAPESWLAGIPKDGGLSESIQSKCLEGFVGCLMAADPFVAQTAVETLEALLHTSSGLRALALIQNETFRSQLDSFSSSYRRKDSHVILSSAQMRAIVLRAGIHESNLEANQWCWRDELWLSFESDQWSFEEWVCALTSGLIACCVATRKNGQIIQRDVDGEFFWSCQKICAVEHNVASNLFPFIVLYLLGVCSDDAENNFNALLTKSFGTVLRSASSHAADVDSESSMKALLLIINTIDVLRKTSQTQFLSRKQSRNIMKIGGRSGTPKSKSSSSDYNGGIPEAAPWEGVPFGVMLKLDGLMVAESCIHVRRYASALFFLDLYLNARYRKAGEVFDELANTVFTHSICKSAACDISGLQQATMPAFRVDDDEVAILKVMSMVGHCYRSMGEYDALEAVTIQSAAIGFNSFGWDAQQSSKGHSDPVGLLRSLNVESDIAVTDEANIVVDSMEALQFHALLQSYLRGILSDGAAIQLMKARDIHRMEEKWHENRLRKAQWELLTLKDAQALAPTGSHNQVHFHVTRLKDFSQYTISEKKGFFAAIGAAHDSYTSDDLPSCLAHLDVGRRSVISEISRTGGMESSLPMMMEVVNKLRAIESMERVWERSGDAASDVFGKTRAMKNVGGTLELMADHLNEFVIAPETTSSEATISFMWLSELATSAAYAMQCACHGPHRQEIFESLVSQICISSVQARKLGKQHVAAEAVQRLHRLLAIREQAHASQEDPQDHILLLRLEESKILESQGDFKGAIRKSQQIVDQLMHREKTSGFLNLQMQHILTDAQLYCGSWLTKYEIRQAGSVLEGYLQPAVHRAKRLYDAHKNIENADRTARAALAIGQIASSLYRALVSRIQSPEWRQTSSTDHHVGELERCEPLLHVALNSKNKAKKGSKQYDDLTRKWEELYIYCEHLRKDLRRTTDERENVVTSTHQYLQLAIESYATALALASTGANEDLLRPVSELMSLWFDNYKVINESDVDINTLMKVAFDQIPTFRFVPLANQLFSRIEKSDGSRSDFFQTVLQDLVFKMCAEHPYHCILPILALANGKKVGSGVSGRHANAYIENVGNSKVAPANAIVSRLKKEAPPYVAGLLESYAILSDSYIHLAGADTSAFQKKTTKDISFSKVYDIGTKALDKCLRKGNTMMEYPPVIFSSIPSLQPSGNYGEGKDDPVGAERVRGFKSVFSITETGLHRPKIVVCLGTKGGEFRQLVKGEDEIRQDAIMSQVFTIVNDLMLRRRSTSDRKSRSNPFPHPLRIVTYNVVPLSPACGVLEWVENTTAFGDVVFGRGSKDQDVGLHARYYPNEWNYLLCRRHFVESPLALKHETYEVVCRHFSSCFRFFFVERFGHDMMAWHSARMRYTRSVAVSSMVGHILGIGDRHTSNILVHTKTGEIVHIDFGIVFEQGKLLHTPERVPFRLTRNMVDGMGPCGTEGTFVRSSEETMRVLRKNAGTLLTILSAVVADPLYKWSVSPVEGMRRQKMGSDDETTENVDIPREGGDVGKVHGSESTDYENEMGKKAIAKINDKLQGYEESTSGEQQGIEGQVQLLINSARDVDNLCLMYPGWSPFV